MKNSKTIQYLNLFDGHGRRRLERFLKSPSNYVYPDVIRAYDVLTSHREHEDELTKELFFQKLFPHKKYEVQKLGNTLKYLNEAIEKFLIQDELNENKMLGAELLARRLRKENFNLYKDSVRKIELSVSGKKIKESSESLLHQFHLHNEKDIEFSILGRREENSEIQLKNDSADAWYILQKLKTACEMKNRENIVGGNYQYTLLNDLIQFLKTEEKHFLKIPAIQIYYHIYFTLTEKENETHYKELIRSLSEHESVLSKEELRMMYDFAQNYCIKKLNSGLSHYASELFKTYKHLLEKKLLLDDERKISPWDYKNLVTLSLRLKEDKWCLKFIQTFVKNLPATEKDNAYKYNLAYYYADRENYGEAKKLLQKVEFTDPFYLLGAKSILLRCYYELEDEEGFLSHCESFKKIVQRHKQVSEYQKTVHLNLILYSRKAFRLLMRKMESRHNVSRKEIEKLKNKIAEVKQINNLVWLNEKMEELAL